MKRAHLRRMLESVYENKVGFNVSVLISIYNSPRNERGELLNWGLRYLQRQNLDPKFWEVVIVDDMSDYNIVPAYSEFVGKLNIVHIRMDHRNHPIWKEMNPFPVSSREEENWPHTPALSTNIAAKYATGQVLCFSQPEILPSENALKRGYTQAMNKRCLIFVNLVLTPPDYREWFIHGGYKLPFEQLWKQALVSLEGKDANVYRLFGGGENYWMFAFLERKWFFRINGVDEEYMRGVYAEDDNFKDRLVLLGIKLFYDDNIYAIHLNHEHEVHKQQQRNTEPWLSWARTNRERYALFRLHPHTFGGYRANLGHDWGSDSCVVEVRRSYILP